MWHLYVVRTADPEALATFLRERGIGTGRHYPEPVHLTEAYARLGYRPGEFPVAEALARECLSLPIFPGITEPQLEAVAGGVAVVLRWLTRPVNDAPCRLLDDVSFGEGVHVAAFTNLYGCQIGAGSRIGPFVEIQRGRGRGRALQSAEPLLRLRRGRARRRGVRRDTA